MNKIHKDIFYEVGFILILFLVLMVAHERTHVSIAQDYGCETDMNVVPSIQQEYLMSVDYDCSNLTKTEAALHHSDQQTVEAIGYQLYALLTVLLILYYVKF